MEINRLDEQYRGLLAEILYNGTEKKDRTGTGTLSRFGHQFKHNMKDGFPLLTTKKMAIKSIITELKWFLKGDTNIKYLVDNGCNIWNGDAKKRYDESFKKYWGEIEGRESKFKPISTKEFEKRILKNDEFAKKWGELGPIYGKQWRSWKRPSTREEKITEPGIYHKYIDQIANLISELKTNPDSRRLMVNAWNVGELDQMVLPPCHYGFQVYTRELSARERTALGSDGSTKLYDSIKESNYETIDADIEMHKVCDKKNIPTRAISLMWNQRSVDTFLGLPFNIASYAMLLCLIAKEVNMVPEQLIGNLGDVHLYKNHIEQAKEQISREPKPHLPKLKLGKVDILNGEFEYEILHYHSHPTIKAPLSN
jgi:thymidylate synthase